MPIDPSNMVRSIAEYAVWEHTARPWQEKSNDIPVVPVINRHTPLLAVVWSVPDNRGEDMDLTNSATTSRVVFVLSAVSQVRKNVARMTKHLHDSVSFNSELIRRDAEDKGQIHLNEYELEYNESYIQDNEEFTAHGIPTPVEIFSNTEAQEFGKVRMTSCYAESMMIFYDPTLDVWKGSVTFIADMFEVPEGFPDLLREI